MTLRLLQLSATAAGLIVAASLTVLAGQQPPPVFRSSVDIVTLDVSVIDRNRQPVRDLTAADFTVLDAGVPQRIVAFESVDLPDRTMYPAPWMHDVASDVSTNHFEPERIVVVLLDDFHVAIDPPDIATTKAVARAIIDELGPADMGAVVYTFFHQNGQEFTTDHARLLASVEKFKPSGGRPPIACLEGECINSVMRGVAESLRAWPGRRKAIAYIGPEARYNFGPQNIEQDTPETPTFEDNGMKRNATPDLVKTFKALQLANVNVYQYDTRGLMGSLNLMNGGYGLFAGNTGGNVVTRSNTPETRVGEMFVENSSYYLLGIEPTNPPKDGVFRPVTIRVNRPGVTVRARGGYFGGGNDIAAAAQPAGTPQNVLDRSMNGVKPMGDLPMTLTVAPFARPGQHRGTVAIVAGLDRPAELAGKDRVRIAARAFDTSTARRTSKGVATATLDLSPRTTARDTHYDVATTLDLPPGEYEIRLAMESTDPVVRGSAFMSVTVPDFAKAPFTLSGIVLGHLPATRPTGRDSLANLLPFTPTTVRSFSPQQRVSAMLRLYQGGKGPVIPANVAVRIVDRRDRQVYSRSGSLTPASFLTDDRVAEFEMTLPLRQLAPGPYLLSVYARAGQATQIRHVRFAVE